MTLPAKRTKTKTRRKVKKSSSEILESAYVTFRATFLSKEKLQSIANQLSEEFDSKVFTSRMNDNYYYVRCARDKGKNVKVLVSKKLHYDNAWHEVMNFLNWCNDNAMANESSELSFDISFDEMKILTRPLETMNMLKFCLDFDESYYKRRFPMLEKHRYSKCLNDIISNNMFSVKYKSNTQFDISDTQYTTVDMRRISDGIVTFNCVRGEYLKEKEKVKETLDYSILGLYRFLQFTEIGKEGELKLSSMLEGTNRYLMPYLNPDMFEKYLPDIDLMVDLKHDPQVRKAIWGNIKDILFNAIMTNKITEACINYESDDASLQVKDLNIEKNGCKFENLTFIDCDLKGKFKNCKFYNCNISDSIIEDSDVFRGTRIEYSEIIESSAKSDTDITRCVIRNNKKILDTKVNKSIWVSGKYGEHTKLDDESYAITHEEADIPDKREKVGEFSEPSPYTYMNADMSVYFKV